MKIEEIFNIVEIKEMQENAAQVKILERECLHLLQAKSEKVCNSYLEKKKFTQLSYFNKDDQELWIALPKIIILKKLISYLNSI